MEKPSLSPAFWRNLAKENPLGRRDIVEQDARDWFDLVWLTYQNYYRQVQKPRHRARICVWWSRLDDQELERGRARGAELRRGAAAADLARLASKAFPSARTPLRTDLPPLNVSRGRAGG